MASARRRSLFLCKAPASGGLPAAPAANGVVTPAARLRRTLSVRRRAAAKGAEAEAGGGKGGGHCTRMAGIESGGAVQNQSIRPSSG